MRSEEELLSLILEVAGADNRIRAVLLNGSRANPNAAKDIFQDFDIVYVVTEMSAFLRNHSWVDKFGKRIILQLPDEMTFGDKDDHAFHYLMLFEDGHRIDLTLFPLGKLSTQFKPDSQTILLLDKDRLFENIPPASDSDYLIRRPTEKEFGDCCNEFWWVSTYVAKGLWRKEITYAKEMLEIPVRTMFLKMIEWHIGVEHDFTISFGKAGRNMKKYISAELYENVLATYPDSDPRNIWNALFLMTGLFSQLARKTAEALKFEYNKQEEENVVEYLKRVHGK